MALTPTQIYESICRSSLDEQTRRVLLRQLIEKYFPEAYKVLTEVPGAPDSAADETRCENTHDGRHDWQDASKNTIVACRACGVLKA